MKTFSSDKAWIPFIVAIFLRLLFILLILPFDNYWDSYHHWQISYYTLKMGFAHQRFWDLNGKEYFWAPLPHLSNAALMMFLNTSSLTPYRVLNSVASSLTAALSYKIVSAFLPSGTGRSAPLLAGLLVALNPLLVYLSSIGIDENLAVLWLSLSTFGILHRRFFVSGLFLAAATLCRIEYGFIALGAMGIWLLTTSDLTNSIPQLLGWSIPVVLYANHLRQVTGNAFYPLTETFRENIQMETPLIGPYGTILTLLTIALVFSVFLLLRRRRSALLATAPFVVHIVILEVTLVRSLNLGLLTSTGRHLMPQFVFLSMLVPVALTRRVRLIPRKVASVLLLVFLLSSCSLYFPFVRESTSNVAEFWHVADHIGRNYRGGTIVCSIPVVTYRLINEWHIPETGILGVTYAPHDRQQLARWMKNHNVSWYVWTSISWDESNKILTLEIARQFAVYQAKVELGAFFIPGSLGSEVRILILNFEAEPLGDATAERANEWEFFHQLS